MGSTDRMNLGRFSTIYGHSSRLFFSPRLALFKPHGAYYPKRERLWLPVLSQRTIAEQVELLHEVSEQSQSKYLRLPAQFARNFLKSLAVSNRFKIHAKASVVPMCSKARVGRNIRRW